MTKWGDLGEGWEPSADDEAGEAEEAELKEACVVVTEAGFVLYMLLRHIGDYIREHEGLKQQPHKGSVENAVDEFYSKYVGRVEIVNGSGEIERVLFQSSLAMSNES